MSGRRPMSAQRRKAAAWRWGLSAMLPLAAVIWLGCSIERHYDILVFFFDGVPDPDAPPGTPAARDGRRTAVVYYSHEPYAQANCDACHATFSPRLRALESSSMCLSCHGEAPTEHPHMHGPVASVSCLWCHAPHESPIRPLLRTASPQMCLQCHGFEFLTIPHPILKDELTRDCLECHSGHGGQHRYFLHEHADPAQAPDESTGQDEP